MAESFEALFDVRAARHQAAIAAGEAGYLDPQSGLFVLTSAYLLARQWCCGNGCRHCPYEQPSA